MLLPLTWHAVPDNNNPNVTDRVLLWPSPMFCERALNSITEDKYMRSLSLSPRLTPARPLIVPNKIFQRSPWQR